MDEDLNGTLDTEGPDNWDYGGPSPFAQPHTATKFNNPMDGAAGNGGMIFKPNGSVLMHPDKLKSTFGDVPEEYRPTMANARKLIDSGTAAQQKLAQSHVRSQFNDTAQSHGIPMAIARTLLDHPSVWGFGNSGSQWGNQVVPLKPLAGLAGRMAKSFVSPQQQEQMMNLYAGQMDAHQKAALSGLQSQAESQREQQRIDAETNWRNQKADMDRETFEKQMRWELANQQVQRGYQMANELYKDSLDKYIWTKDGPFDKTTGTYPGGRPSQEPIHQKGFHSYPAAYAGEAPDQMPGYNKSVSKNGTISFTQKEKPSKGGGEKAAKAPPHRTTPDGRLQDWDPEEKSWVDATDKDGNVIKRPENAAKGKKSALSEKSASDLAETMQNNDATEDEIKSALGKYGYDVVKVGKGSVPTWIPVPKGDAADSGDDEEDDGDEAPAEAAPADKPQYETGEVYEDASGKRMKWDGKTWVQP